jgi:hypothetical protein
VVDRCREAIPPLDEVAADHVAACWFAKDLPTLAPAAVDAR